MNCDVKTKIQELTIDSMVESSNTIERGVLMENSLGLQGRQDLSGHIASKDQNFLLEVNVGCKLCLDDIVLQAVNAKYNRGRDLVIMKIANPETKALIKASGDMKCIGAKNEKQAIFAARKAVKFIQRLGFPAAKF